MSDNKRVKADRAVFLFEDNPGEVPSDPEYKMFGQDVELSTDVDHRPISPFEDHGAIDDEYTMSIDMSDSE